ncbi:hypothetical protein AYI70_g3214 [Smittium culicis]|uniref:Uncharacterized protein n=1 Tax=Smittium culicis TaxID=133412 RepID=A0A1R1Y4W1_9FUNG|nr:hypothetical protein AYI70_g3214 [Smittium culicis]
MGVIRVKELFRDMESAAGTDAYQFRGVSDDLIYATSQGGDRTINSIRTIDSEPRKCPRLTNCENGMNNIRTNIHNAECYFWTARRGTVRLQQEKEAESLLQLVSGYQGSRDQLSVVQLD